MRPLVSELGQVRRIGRWMLIAQRLCQWITALIVTMITLGLLDYLLRLPGAVRLTVILLTLIAALGWLTSRLNRVWRFNPRLSLLALRAERLYPQVAGSLASAVELQDHSDHPDQSPYTRAMTARTISEVESHLAGRRLRDMLAWQQTLRLGLLAGAAVLLAAGVVLAAPMHSRLALQRWLLPLGDARWQTRTSITSRMRQNVWAQDSPVRFEAAVDRGYRKSLRTWVVFQVIDANGQAGAWAHRLMAQQTPRDAADRAGGAVVFERLIDFAAELNTTSSAPTTRHTVNYYFQAGDDQTPTGQLELAPRPTVTRVRAQITPPAYAAGLAGEQQLRLDQQAGPVAAVSALIGSQVRLRFDLNKSVPITEASLATILPGFAGVDSQRMHFTNTSHADDGASLQVEFTLTESMRTAVHLTDADGLSNLSDREYQVHAVADREPVVSLVEPVADESVLATAMIPLHAAARDDVGVESLVIRQAHQHGQATSDQPVVVAASPQARNMQLDVTHTFDLSPLNAQPGDRIELTAVAGDVYRSEGKPRDLVVSSPRVLQVVDALTLVGQVRSELAVLRQQAMRLDARQQALKDRDTGEVVNPQNELTQRVQMLEQRVTAQARRLARNRLDPDQAGGLTQMLPQAGELLNQAAAASQRAGDLAKRVVASDQPEPQADQQRRDAQGLVSQKLGELAQLLDQGRDALTLQLLLQELATRQRTVGDQTRSLLPQTLGRSPRELAEAQRQALGDLAARQDKLAKQSDLLVEQMQSAAEALSRQSREPRDLAAAAALAQAAAIAQRQGLAQRMAQAGDMVQRNQLSQASQQQQDNLGIIQEMLEQLKEQDQRRREILKRQLLELARAIERLIQQQQAAIQRSGPAENLASLIAPLTTLWQNTLAVSAQAMQVQETAAAGGLVSKAADAQAVAVTALREAEKPQAIEAQTTALAHLQAALDAVKQQARDNQQDQTRKERDELRQAYLKLAGQQKLVRDKTAKLAQVAEPDRRQRAGLVALGDQQRQVADDAAQLRKKVDQTLVFEYTHEQIDTLARGIAQQLKAATADTVLVSQQTMVASLLQAMAQALDSPLEDEPFAGQNPDGDGAGGRQGQSSSNLVALLAELKLLRGVQQTVYLQTRELWKTMQQTGRSDPLDAQLQALGRQHEQLSMMTQALARKLQDQRKQQEQNHHVD